METALMTLTGPIIKFAIGSIAFFVVLMLVLLSQRQRIRKNTFRSIMKTAAVLWLFSGIAFFYWLSKHLNP